MTWLTLSRVCFLVPFREERADGRCDDRLAESSIPAVAITDDGSGVREAGRDAAASNQNYFQFLLRLTEIELATRPPTQSRPGSRTRNSRS